MGYCAKAFISAEDGEKWFISHITRMNGDSRSNDRLCLIPRDLLKPTEKEVLALGGAYTHQRGENESAPMSWRPTHFLNQNTGETWEHDVTVFSVENPGTCLVYDFNGFSRVVNIWRDDQFVPIGTVYNNEGVIQALKRKD